MATEAVIFQQIVDMNWDQAIYTASPNNTINVAQFAAKGDGTNIGIALTPKGTGYISAQVPDGTATGGNARGARSVDLQTQRSVASRVASGANSFIGGGNDNTVSGAGSAIIAGSGNSIGQVGSVVLGGSSNTINGSSSVASGTSIIINSAGSAAFGNGNISLDAASYSLTTGSFGRSTVQNQRCHGGGAATGSLQIAEMIVSANTTTNAEVELTTKPSNTRLILRANSIFTGIVHVLGNKTDGSAVASYCRQVTIKRIGTSTSLVGSVNVIGTDEAAGTSISITADDTNESLRIAATGVLGETWNWIAVVYSADKTLTGA
jgi:hypothetical protein